MLAHAGETDFDRWMAEREPQSLRTAARAHRIHAELAVPLLARGTTLGVAIALRNLRPEVRRGRRRPRRGDRGPGRRVRGQRPPFRSGTRHRHDPPEQPAAQGAARAGGRGDRPPLSADRVRRGHRRRLVRRHPAVRHPGRPGRGRRRRTRHPPRPPWPALHGRAHPRRRRPAARGTAHPPRRPGHPPQRRRPRRRPGARRHLPVRRLRSRLPPAHGVRRRTPRPLCCCPTAPAGSCR